MYSIIDMFTFVLVLPVNILSFSERLHNYAYIADQSVTKTVFLPSSAVQFGVL